MYVPQIVEHTFKCDSIMNCLINLANQKFAYGGTERQKYWLSFNVWCRQHLATLNLYMQVLRAFSTPKICR